MIYWKYVDKPNCEPDVLPFSQSKNKDDEGQKGEIVDMEKSLQETGQWVAIGAAIGVALEFLWEVISDLLRSAPAFIPVFSIGCTVAL